MKISQKQQEHGKELMREIIQKSWEDTSFKKQLINNPKQTIEQLVGGPFDIAEGRTIKVEDQTDESFIYLNIPAQPNFENFELSDEELEVVAGGETPILGVAALFVASVAAGIHLREATR